MNDQTNSGSDFAVSLTTIALWIYTKKSLKDALENEQKLIIKMGLHYHHHIFIYPRVFRVAYEANNYLQHLPTQP